MLFLAKRHVWSEIVALVVLRAMTQLLRRPDSRSSLCVGWRAVYHGVGAAAGIGVGDLLIYGALHMLAGRQGAGATVDGLRVLYREASVPAVLGGGMLAGLGEEPFFRGVLQERFGLAGAALAFAAAHVAGPSLRVPSIWAMYDGLALGLAYHWSGNLAVPMIAHALHDIVAGFWLKVGRL